MKEAIVFIFFLFSIITIQAQNIQGYVFSRNDKLPIEFAQVVLIRLPDSIVVIGALTQKSGQYQFDCINPGEYFIKASFLGFKTNGKNIMIGNKSERCDTIFLTEDLFEITEVTVTSEYIKGNELIDRTVYNIPQEIVNTSINGFEVLRKIPPIQVDLNNNIKLNGSSNFIVQVDGKMRNKEFLAKLLPADIKSIEVIRDPSGKYEGNVDGVINIVLNDVFRYGLNGNLNIMSRPYKDYKGGATGSLDYGFRKISIYATGNSFIQNFDCSSTSYYRYGWDTINTISNLSGSGKFKLKTYAINTGLDYYINDKNSLSLNYSFKPNFQDIQVYNLGNISNNDSLMNNIKYPVVNNMSSHENSVSLFYQKQYARPIQELTAELRCYNFYSLENNDYNRQYIILDSTPVSNIVVNENNYDNRFALTGKLDYVYPIGISSQIELGYQLYYQTIKYNYLRNNNNNNRFQYNEVRNAGYAGITLNFRNLGFQSNIRAEFSSNYIDKTERSDYISLLPSIRLFYKITGTQNIKVTYNRRINRPGIGDLYPFAKISDLSLTQGYPFLKPEYKDKMQLTYTLNFSKNYISSNIYYTMISNKIGFVNELIESPLAINGEIILSSPRNILSGYEQGIELNAMLKFIKISARVYQGHYNAYKKENIVAQNYASFSINSYMFGKLPLKINGFAFINYDGPSFNAQSKTSSTPFYGFGAQKIMSNHTLGLFYLLPFSKDITVNRIETKTLDFYKETSFGFDISYYIQILYSYKFNKGRAINKVNREFETEGDSKVGGLKDGNKPF